MARTLPLSSVLLSVLGLAAPALAEPAVAARAQPVPGGAEPVAEAEHEGRLPVAEAERPITLPRFILSPEVDFDIARSADVGGSFANLSIGASFGITDDLTVRVIVLPLQLAGPAGTGFHYGQSTEVLGPGIGATFRFLKGPVELGVSLDANIITAQDVSGVVVQPGVPVRAHLSKQLRLDTGVFVPVEFQSETTVNPGPLGAAPSAGSRSRNTVGISVPVSLLYDITEPIHVGVGTGFAIDDFNQAGDTSRIPVGVFAGYAIAGKEGPILDIDPFFMFPKLITPGAPDKTETGEWAVGLSVGGFLYL